MLTRHRTIAASLAAGLLAATSAPALAAPQSGEEAYYRAYFLEHEEGDLEGALALYEKAAKKGPKELRQRAARAAAAVTEDLIASDFARVMPPGAIVYAEITRPGERAEALLSQLGLLGSVEAGPERYRISPLLVRSLLGLRGAAVAVTEIDPQGGEPDMVAVFHPGDLAIVRGMIETAVPSGGTAVDPIAGFPTWNLEGEAFLTMTEKLVIVSPNRAQIEGVARRLTGEDRNSLASNESIQHAMSMRGDDLLFFCVNAEPVMPMIMEQLNREATGDAGAAMAMTMLDVKSLRSVAGRLTLGGEGLALELALDLAEGHRNLAFNLMRKPTLEQRTFELVPDEVAFFLATSLNKPMPAQARAAVNQAQDEERIVTAMDFGREVFGNVVDIAFFGMPPTAASAGPIPDIAAVVRVNDPAQSRALWKLMLGLASQGSGAPTMEPELVQVAGVEAERYELEGVPIYMVTTDGEMVISPSASAIERSIHARKKGRSVLDDPLFAAPLRELEQNSTFAFVCNPGRAAQMAGVHMSPAERQQMAPVAQLLEKTTVSVCVEHSSTRLALRAALAGVPDVSQFVAHMIDAQRGHGAKHVHSGHSGNSHGAH